MAPARPVEVVILLASVPEAAIAAGTIIFAESLLHQGSTHFKDGFFVRSSFW
jgi:hypothetical protein